MKSAPCLLVVMIVVLMSGCSGSCDDTSPDQTAEESTPGVTAEPLERPSGIGEREQVLMDDLQSAPEPPSQTEPSAPEPSHEEPVESNEIEEKIENDRQEDPEDDIDEED